jgi:hypothetical protein
VGAPEVPITRQAKTCAFHLFDALHLEETIVIAQANRHSVDRHGTVTTKIVLLRPSRPRVAGGKVQGTERRRHERRFSDDLFFLVERRNGSLWKYGSIALCCALWANLGCLLLR